MIHMLLIFLAVPIFGLKSPPWGTPNSRKVGARKSSIQNSIEKLLHSHPPRGGTIADDEKDAMTVPQPCLEIPEHSIEPKYGILFIDRFCHYHGGYLAAKARDVYGVATIHSLSTYVSGYMEMTARESGQPPSHLRMTIPSPDKLEDWKTKIPFETLAVICESDSGLEEAELIGEAMGVRFHNGFNPARRDKFQMNDVLSRKGMRVVKQKMCLSLEEALEFAKELGVVSTGAGSNEDHDSGENSYTTHDRDTTELEQDKELNRGNLGRGSNSPGRPSNDGKFCVIKPKRGVASDDVQFCSNLDDVKIAFERIQGTAVFGSISGERNDAVVRS